MHRYTFPADQSSHFILDLDHGYADGPGVVQWASLKLMGDTVLGGKSTLRWAKGREIYFAMKFSRPWDRVEILVDGKPLESTIDEIKSQSIKAVFHFATKDQEKILVKTGISGVNSDGAQLNLNREIPAWDFNGIRARASELWEKELSRIQVAGGTERQREIFYTALYHSFLAPTTFDDVDGKYRGMDGAVHQLAQGERNYSTFSTWDTYRALHPLFTIVQPEKVPGMVNCLIRMAGQSPLGMPIWPLQAKDTGTMTGYHSASIIAEAVQKKFGGIDIASAYQVMKREAAESQVRGLPLYRQYGFIPCDLDSQSVSKSLDYNYNDWALACVATAFGAKEDAENYRTRSLNYKNLYDSATRFMRPKLANGEWAEPFAANEMGHSKRWRDYTESNPWQATFAVQHDPNGLAHLFGGRKMLEERLDDLFGASSAQPADAPSDIAGLVGQYAHGNEPSHHIAYLYVYAGAAHKTQDRIANLLETMYDNKPDGLVGNEDCGQMSAWYVMSAMGFYAVDPINGSYVFGTPIFDKVTIDVGRGRRFILTTRRQSANEKYIAAIRWKGAAYDKLWFRHEDIVGGGSFELKMSAKPNAEFASGSESAPPSLSPAQTT